MRRVLFSIVCLLVSGSIYAAPIRSALGAFRGYDDESSVPYDSEVEYLESTGGDYIYVPHFRKSNLIDITVVGSFSPTSRNMNYLWELWYGNNIIGLRCYKQEEPQFLSVISSVYTTGINPLEIHEYRMYNTNSTEAWPRMYFEVDGVQLTTLGYNNQEESERGLSLFSLQPWNSNYNSSGIRIYHLFGSSSNVKIDLIPVRFTNENGETEGAMYDKVSKELFSNQGTGSFLIGPDKE